MSTYPHIAYLAASPELMQELVAARVPVPIKGRAVLYPHREQAEIQNVDPTTQVRPVSIHMPHGACFQVSLGGGASGEAPGNYLFTHFAMAHDFAQMREPASIPRISIFAPHETRHIGKDGAGRDVVVAIDVEHYPAALKVTMF